jgi:hypothetical protein
MVKEGKPVNHRPAVKETTGATLAGIPAADLRELVVKSHWTCDSNRTVSFCFPSNPKR